MVVTLTIASVLNTLVKRAQEARAFDTVKLYGRKGKAMRVKKTKTGFVVSCRLNNSLIEGKGKTKDEAIKKLLKSMTVRLNKLENEINSLHSLNRFVKQVINGTAGC